MNTRCVWIMAVLESSYFPLRLSEAYSRSCNIQADSNGPRRKVYLHSVHKSDSRANEQELTRPYVMSNIVMAPLDHLEFSKLGRCSTYNHKNPNWPRNIQEPLASLVTRTRDSNDLTHAWHDLLHNLATLVFVPIFKWKLAETNSSIDHERPLCATLYFEP